MSSGDDHGGMDRSDLLALAPHYAVMLLIVFVALGVWRAYVGEIGLLGEFAIIAVIVFSYRPVVKRLGIAPEPWQD
jgi:hypothetical protein